MRRPRTSEQPYTGATLPLGSAAAPDKKPRRALGAPSSNKPRRSPMQRIRRIARRLLWTALGIILLSCVGLVLLQQMVARKVVVRDLRSERPVRNFLTAPMNILLLGIDLRPDHPGEGVRSDTVMLLHLEPGNGWASMLAIPRDSLAEVDGEGETKINRGFASGYEGSGGDVAAGMASAADAVERFLALRQQGQRLDYVATVNFDGFAAIVDALGGVEIDVPRRIVDPAYPTPDFGTRVLVIEAGRQHMDGPRALEYVRTRHADSDFGRGQRQQQVLQAMSHALRNKPLVLRPFVALRVLNAASGAIQTTFPVGRLDALLLALQLARFDPSSIMQYQLSPDTVAVQEEGSNLRWEQEGVSQLVGKLLAPPDETQEAARIQVLNGAGVPGLAGAVTEVLGNARFTLIPADNADPVPESRIFAYGDKPLTRRRLQKVLRNMPIEQRPVEEAPPNTEFVVLLGDDYASYVEP